MTTPFVLPDLDEDLEDQLIFRPGAQSLLQLSVPFVIDTPLALTPEPPVVTFVSPVDGASNVAKTTGIAINIADGRLGADVSTLDVDVDGVPAIVNGLFVNGFSGSIDAVFGGYDVILLPPASFIPAATVVVDVTVADLSGASANETMSFQVAEDPPIVVFSSSFFGVFGSFVQLDGRDVASGNTATRTWTLVEAPYGSTLAVALNVPNHPMFTELRDNYTVVSFAPDTLGYYTIVLRVSEFGVSTTKSFVVRMARLQTPSGRGVVPPARYLWDYISDFWSQLENRDLFEMYWSALIQVVGADFSNAISHDSNKSLQDIQEVAIRRWNLFEPWKRTRELRQGVFVGDATAGIGAGTGPLLAEDEVDFATILGTSAGPFALAGLTLELVVDDSAAQTIVFAGPNPVSAASAVLQVNTVLGEEIARNDGNQIRLTSTISGPESRIKILGGTALAALGFTAGDESIGSFPGLTRILWIPLGTRAQFGVDDVDNFARIDVNHRLRGRIVHVNGTSHVIDRQQTLTDADATFDAVYRRSGTSWESIRPQTIARNDDVELFGTNGDYVYLGHFRQFSKIRVELAVPASGTITPVFEYRTEAGWVAFSPTDATAGWTTDGAITFVPSALVGWSREFDGPPLEQRSLFWIRISRTAAVLATPPTEEVVYLVDSYTVLYTKEETLPDGLRDASYRVPAFLKFPGEDTGAWGVTAGDRLELEFSRLDTSAVESVTYHVTGAVGELVGFELVDDAPENGELPGPDVSKLVPVVRELGLVPKDAADVEFEAAARALLVHTPTGVNLSARPFTSGRILVHAKLIRRHTEVPIDPRIVGIESLQSVIRAFTDAELRADPRLILDENRQYHVDAARSRLVFHPGTWTPELEVPEMLWAENTFTTNLDVVEANFGALVGFLREDMSSAATSGSYLDCVRALIYAATQGPEVDSIRLAIQVLLGLPFTTDTVELLSDEPDFEIDALGRSVGRLLVEQVDENGARTGIRKFLKYPVAAGLEINRRTSEVIQVGDVIDAYRPVSRGVVVSDEVNTPGWWAPLRGEAELQKFHTFRAQADVDAFPFSVEELVFSLNFVRGIKAAHTQLLASIKKEVEEEDISDLLEDSIEGSTIQALMYDNHGPIGGLEATYRTQDLNHQGLVLWPVDGPPFSTRSERLVVDVSVAVSGPDVVATSAAGFGTVRTRVSGDATHPVIEGDLLALWPAQEAFGEHVVGLLEFTAGSGPNGPLTLGNEAPRERPQTWAVNAPDISLFPTGTDLVGAVLRRDQNPVVRGADLVTDGTNLVVSAGSDFIQDSVGLEDRLVFESGANFGEYRVTHVNTLASPRDYTQAGAPKITATTLRLLNLDGSVPALSAAAGQDFRIVRPCMIRKNVPGARVVVDGGDKYIEVLDLVGGGEPFDVFTPGMVGGSVTVVGSENPTHDFDYEIFEYIHAGRIRITNTGAEADVDDVTATARIQIRSPYHDAAFEDVEDLSVAEVFSAVVT